MKTFEIKDRMSLINKALVWMNGYEILGVNLTDYITDERGPGIHMWSPDFDDFVKKMGFLEVKVLHSNDKSDVVGCVFQQVVVYAIRAKNV